MSYILRVYHMSRFVEVFTPSTNNRKIEINFDFANDTLSLPLSVLGSVWTLIAPDDIQIFYKDKQIVSKEIQDGDIFQLHKNETEYALVVERNFPEYSNFRKYSAAMTQVNIGSRSTNEIVYARNLVSGFHASIVCENSTYFIVDLQSSNGTYLNGFRVVKKEKLSFGDIIDIVGLKIVYLGSVFAINEVRSSISIQSLIPLNDLENTDVPLNSTLDDEYYSRSPRQLEKLDLESVEIEPPPGPSKSRRQPIMYVVGPAVTMVIPITIGVLFTTYSMQNVGGTTSPMLFMGIITSVTAAIIGAFWAVTNYRYNKRIEIEEEQKRNDKYRAYLVKMKQKIVDKQQINKDKLNIMYPSMDKTIEYVASRNRRNYERNINHYDFLTVRLGVGERQSYNEILIPKERFSLVDDDLIEEPERIRDEYHVIKDVPITINLAEHSLIGALFNHQDDAMDLMKGIITNLAAYHSYQDVKLVIITNQDYKNLTHSVKWLPHVWSNDEKIRFIGSNEQSISEISYYLTSLFREREEMFEEQKEKFKPLPHFVVLVTDPALIDNETMSKYLIHPSTSISLTTILMYSKIDKLPNHCNVIIQKDDEFSGYYSLDVSFDSFPNLQFDTAGDSEFHQLCLNLSNIVLKDNYSSGKIPISLGFLDMYKTSNISELDIYRRWMQNRTFESMRALIGYKGEDLPIYLDIHEKYHGPHGLVAGTTGSGKSETLQTYILSLAINYHPHEISFILIDYKGGGMANSFENLPHLAGIITNLGGNQTNRALASINSEIKRRQGIFSENKVKHIDEYIELYRCDKVANPIPHLIIIADEFAELKKEQPEFVSALVSASRVGRSLGVHLILATQKPSGVVDDEIWGNSRFRLCLRVQDKQDSMEMLKRSDAAYITNPGRGFFQVGNNEIFEEFQSGYSGALYLPENPYVDAKNHIVRGISLWGSTVNQASVQHKVRTDQREKQIAALVGALSDVATQSRIKGVNRIWLPPLAELISLDDFGSKISSSNLLEVCIGLVDDPLHQRQYPYFYRFVDQGHFLIVGSVMSGKTTLLQTILYSLVKHYSADSVQIYIADYNSRILSCFQHCPAVGGVIFDDEQDKTNKLMKMMLKELSLRKKKLSSVGVGSYREYIRQHHDLPAVVFVIDNYSAYIELNPTHEDDLIVLSREASSYGIYLLITTSTINDIRNRIRQNLGSAIGLQLTDRFEYEQVIGGRVEIVAEEKVAGRGMIYDNYGLEIQVATPIKTDFAMMNQQIREEMKSLFDEYRGTVALRIPEIPSDLTLNYFLDQHSDITLSNQGIPLGYDLDESTPVYLSIKDAYCISISGLVKSGKRTLLQNMMAFTSKQGASNIIIAPGSIKLCRDHMSRHIETADQLYQYLSEELIPQFQKRGKNKDQLHDFSPIFIYIFNFSYLLEMIYTYPKDMKQFLEQAVSVGKGYGVYFVAAISAEDMTGEYNTKRFFRSFISYKDGLHLGGNTDQQRIFDFDIPIFERSKRLPAGSGHRLSDGKTIKMITFSSYD